MRLVIAATLTIVILGILTLATNHAIAQKANGFIPNPTNNNNTGTATSDPNYDVYQNLALGFNIKYLKNMTISEKLQNGSFNTLVHVVSFHIPLDKPYNEHMTMEIGITPVTNFLGQQYSLDLTVRNALAAFVGNNVTVTNKIQGMLDGFPAYKIEDMALIPKVFKNITSSLGYDGIPIKYEYRTTYVSFRDGIGYWITFFTYSPDRFNALEKTMIDSFRYN